jgi:hypothetical protein
MYILDLYIYIYIYIYIYTYIHIYICSHTLSLFHIDIVVHITYAYACITCLQAFFSVVLAKTIQVIHIYTYTKL